ncbi:hypothetical protein BKA70DRAFT_715165 [Coprinopsis sp. MPI-PUGE-AT-0042]|nr:hypothetical protein BKA70DRAFT_715165 [Coprinopsis sp. MPI-PUGE-AT-0042]
MALVQNRPSSPPTMPFPFYPSFLAQAGPPSPQQSPVSTKPVGSRPLPSIPAGDVLRQSHIPFVGTSSIRHPLLTPQSERRSSDLSDSASRVPRQPRLSSRFQSQPATRDRTIPSLFVLLSTSSILHVIVALLDWADVYSLLTSCRRLTDTFQSLPLRDVVLSRFVPGYAQCLRVRDMQFYQDIPITVFDLNRLLISQRVPLHRYPIHALKIIQAWYPTLEDDQTREKLAQLAQAHSRFVLLLQSLVHSSSASIPQESEEVSYRPRFSPIQTLRELTFPAPLSYSEPPKTRSSSVPPNPKLSKHARHKSAPPAGSSFTSSHLSTRSSSAAWSDKLRSPPHTSADTISTIPTRKTRKLSIFGKRRPVTPPPPLESRALKMYSSTWRKSAMYGPAFTLDFVGYDDMTASSTTTPTGTLKRFQVSPRRRRLGSSNDSSDSSSLSISRSRNSMSLHATRPTTATSTDGGIGAKSAGAPHDLTLATSRTRAPILRVFVPCTKLEMDGESLALCEQQLVESGLWDHLSTGDIICNLGYVPPVDETPDEVGSEVVSPAPPTRPGTGSRRSSSGLVHGSGSSNSAKWLLFNGHVLVPFTPPELLPLTEPLNLPTPFYYVHIMPPNANPLFIINRLPVCDDLPQFTLIHSSKRVKSPHSPNGHALVKKYSWTARVVRVKCETDGEMGEGWFGEWVLEGEGTTEGKELLLDALRGVDLGRREWELVREKSGGGKIWLRLLTI